jgi:hypothetical protein
VDHAVRQQQTHRRRRLDTHNFHSFIFVFYHFIDDWCHTFDDQQQQHIWI